MMPNPMQHDLIGHSSGNMHHSEPNPNQQQHFSTADLSDPSTPMQTDRAWVNPVALSVEINKGHGSVTSQTTSSESSPDMPYPDSVVCHSAQTSPNLGHYEPGFVRSEVARLERRLENPSAPQYSMPITYNIPSEGGFNPMVNSVPGSAANWMEKAPTKLGPTDGGRKMNNAPEQFYHQNISPTNKKRQLGEYNDDHEHCKMSRPNQLYEATFEKSAQNLNTTGAPWRGDYSNHQVQTHIPGVQAQAHAQAQASDNQRSSGPDYQFSKHNQIGRESDQEPYKMPHQGDAHGPAQNLERVGVPWQRNHHNQSYQVPAYDPSKYPGSCSQGDAYGSTSSQMHVTTGASWQESYNDQSYKVPEHDPSKYPGSNSAFPGTTSHFSTHCTDATLGLGDHFGTVNQSGPVEQTFHPQGLQKEDFALNSCSENTNQTGPEYQALTDNYPQHLQNSVPITGQNFNPPTNSMAFYSQQWIPDNNDNMGLMDLDWVYPEGVCNFGTYSNYVNEIDPWNEVKAERESFSSRVSAPELLQMSNNEEESSSTLPSVEVAAPPVGATRPLAPTQGLGLSEEEEAALIATRAKNCGYSRKCTDKRKGTRKHYQNELLLLPQKVSRPRQYRANIDRNMVFVGKALENWHAGILGDETRAYEDGMEELCKKFDEKKSLDSELIKAREKHAAYNQKFLDAEQEYKQTGTSSAGSRKSRAKANAEHWENVCNVLNLQWTLLLETKLAELATLYFQRTIPTVISKLRPILNDVREQCYQNDEVRGFEDFLQFLKEHRHLFMVPRRNLPSISTGFIGM